MPGAIKFIGNYDVTANGKFLWEILCQLRQLGVGRLVTKNEWGRKWPEQPSYLKIVRARPDMDRWLHSGKVWAEWTFRGRDLGLYEFSADLNRSDWRLIHKHEEASFTKCANPMKDFEIPDSMPTPPLQILLTKKYAKKNGLEYNKAWDRIPLELCLDAEHLALKPFFKMVKPKKLGRSIYEENDPDTWLDLYGAELPTKVEAWNIGPATLQHRFASSFTMKPTRRASLKSFENKS
ncbi:hypothetical protein AB6A40_006235 [Gnathostoma spinigerum]|uniref:Uncharacterized protein n=1 Tax=Gnathostoma spinigerum TaxID=75299 RepID=A0ABD6EQ15_9BILA